jgi:hypothetical protein
MDENARKMSSTEFFNYNRSLLKDFADSISEY